MEDLRRRLGEGGEGTGGAADCTLPLEKEGRRRVREEHREEGQGVQRRPEERERGMEDAGKEELGQKACKDKRNQARASVGEDGETGEDSLNGSGGADPLMERYLSSAIPKRSPYSWTEDSLEEHSLLENSGNYRSAEFACRIHCSWTCVLVVNAGSVSCVFHGPVIKIGRAHV